MTEGQRRRDSAATRAALLDAATELFADRGYDRTTVRDIAARAAVNQALLFRYFGSKEALFAEVLARQGRDRLAESPPEQRLARILRGLLDPGPARVRNHALETVLRSSGQDKAAQAIRLGLGEEYARALAELSDAPDAEVRGDLVLAWLLGIGLLRSVTGKEPLASADPEVVVRLVLRAARVLLERIED